MNKNKNVPSTHRWGREENAFLIAMRMQKDDETVHQLGLKLPDPNIAHITRDNEFSMLFHASMENSLKGFEVLLECGADPTWANKNGTTVFLLCARRNQIDMMNLAVKKLSKKQIEKVSNGKSSKGWTILMAACEANKKEIVEWLLKNNADPNAQMGLTSWTAMHAASKNGNIEILKMLLDAGGNPELEAEHREIGYNLNVADAAMVNDKFQEIVDLIKQYNAR